MNLYYWAPFLSKVATVNSVLNSASSLQRYSKNNIKTYIINDIKTLLCSDKYNIKKISLCGHSLGGPLCTMVLLDLLIGDSSLIIL